MKKIDKQNKANLVFEIVSDKQSFVDEVSKLRIKLKIPEDGFKKEKDLEKWKNRIIKDNLGGYYLKWIENTLAAYKLYPMFYQKLEEYILGIKESNSPNVDEFCNSFIKDDGRLHIVVNPYASISDVEDYINSNRSKLQQQLVKTKEMSNWPKRIKSRKNSKRDAEIYNLSKKSLIILGELDNNYDYRTISKSSLIERIVNKKLNSAPSSHRIESIIKEQKKKRKS